MEIFWTILLVIGVIGVAAFLINDARRDRDDFELRLERAEAEKRSLENRLERLSVSRTVTQSEVRKFLDKDRATLKERVGDGVARFPSTAPSQQTTVRPGTVVPDPLDASNPASLLAPLNVLNPASPFNTSNYATEERSAPSHSDCHSHSSHSSHDSGSYSSCDSGSSSSSSSDF